MRDDIPPHLQAIFDALDRAGPQASIEDVNRTLDEARRQYNASPQPELGGLSPDEMAGLLSGDWRSTGVLRLDESLSRVLEPLAHFGLLETRMVPSVEWVVPDREYRLTPLFTRFMHFELPSRPDLFLVR